MRTFTKLLLITAVLVAFTAAPASATSRSRVLVTINAVGDDLGNASTAANDNDLIGLSDACDSLFRHASAGLGYTRPAPISREAWRHIKKAWSLFAQAGLLCGEGADQVDADLITQSTALITRGNTETSLATEAL